MLSLILLGICMLVFVIRPLYLIQLKIPSFSCHICFAYFIGLLIFRIFCMQILRLVITQIYLMHMIKLFCYHPLCCIKRNGDFRAHQRMYLSQSRYTRGSLIPFPFIFRKIVCNSEHKKVI